MLYEILALPMIGDIDLSGLEMIMCGGQAVSKATTLRAQELLPDVDFIQVYGLTEGGASLSRITPADARRKPGSAGRASMFSEIRIVGTDGVEVPAHTDGEIIVRGASVTAGYWDDKEMTARLITEDEWLYTGDMGYLDDEGLLYISGRRGDMIISGGMNIFPAEIEDVLRTHPLVADIAVVGLPHEKWGETVCAVVQPVPGSTIDVDEVVAYCTRHLAGFKKPRTVHVIDELPRTAGGKPKKFLLREWYANGHENGRSRPRDLLAPLELSVPPVAAPASIRRQ
jgi:acyl-CoA synthetase (AMP-forming)/AMP-acid ligase II